MRTQGMKPNYNQRLRELLKELCLTQVTFSKAALLPLNKIRSWLAPTSSPRYKVMTSHEFYNAKENVLHLMYSKRALEKSIRLSASIDNAVHHLENAANLIDKDKFDDAKNDLRSTYEAIMEAYYTKQAMGL